MMFLTKKMCITLSQGNPNCHGDHSVLCTDCMAPGDKSIPARIRLKATQIISIWRYNSQQRTVVTNWHVSADI